MLSKRGGIMFFSRSAGHKYIDRGFITANDYRIGDFTLDDAYHTLDLSSIIAAGSVVCMLFIALKGDAGGLKFVVKKNGADNDYNVFSVFTQVANLSAFAFGIVAPDENGIIEYSGSVSGITAADMIVKGWLV